MSHIRAAITAVGAFLPERILTNADLEAMVDTTNEWILERTGIHERRILPNGQGTSVMAEAAVRQLLERRGMDAEEIDVMICATVTPDMLFPATANIVADRVGATQAWGFDLEAACSSFLYGLTVGAQFIETGRYQKIVVVGADKMSSIIDYEDRTTSIIFGDGAGAVLLEPSENGVGIQDFILHSDGSGARHLHMKAGGSLKPASLDTVRAREHYVYQEGRPVFKRAITHMSDVASRLMERNQLTPDDLAWVIPHQANMRIIEAMAQRVGIPTEKVVVNIQRYGNTTSATLPLCLWELVNENRVQTGDRLLFTAFGGGFTWGALYLTWG